MPELRPKLLKRKEKVCCARLRGLTHTCATRTGSISFPDPMSWLPVAVTCVIPSGVSSRSVLPVYLPFFVHSVSLELYVLFRLFTQYARGTQIETLTTVAGEEDARCRGVEIGHDRCRIRPTLYEEGKGGGGLMQ